jgi:hypothetical protein
MLERRVSDPYLCLIPAPAVLAALLLSLMALPGSAQERCDIKHYDLVIKPDFDAKTVGLTATVAIDNPGLLDAFSFGLNSGYDSVAVTANSSPAQTERGPGRITVKLGKPTDHAELRFDLAGTLGRSNDENVDIVRDNALFLLWSDRFYPIDFEDWATLKTTIVLPPGFKAVAPGKLTSKRSVGDKVEYVFETSKPAVCFSVFADSRWVESEREVAGLTMRTLLHPESGEFSDQILASSKEVLDFYSQMYCPYPFDEFACVTIDGIYARRAFPGFVGYSPDYLRKEFTTTGHDAHETALLWWFYTLRGSGPGSFQWTEGFGDYAEFLYDEKHGKPIPTVFQQFRDEFLKSPEDDVPYDHLSGQTPQKIVHGKYPWLMHLLRYVAGDEAFARAMRLLFERFSFRTFTMDEFVSTLEKGCGKSLKWWREEWLERKGVPDLSMRYDVREVDGEYRITVDLRQVGNTYHFPLEIGIETASGMRIEKTELAKKQTLPSFTSSEEPKRIVLDPNGWVLMKKSEH